MSGQVNFDFSGKRVLVTGASQGIGLFFYLRSIDDSERDSWWVGIIVI